MYSRLSQTRLRSVSRTCAKRSRCAVQAIALTTKLIRNAASDGRISCNASASRWPRPSSGTWTSRTSNVIAIAEHTVGQRHHPRGVVTAVEPAGLLLLSHRGLTSAAATSKRTTEREELRPEGTTRSWLRAPTDVPVAENPRFRRSSELPSMPTSGGTQGSRTSGT